MTSASKFLFALGLGVALVAAQQNNASQAAEVNPAFGPWLANLRADLRVECQQVDSALAREGDDTSRAELLAMYGRSAWASGEFGKSAAAYAMFLAEFGIDHPYSEQILVRLGASLAPLNLDSVDVLHTASGPEYRPMWRMGKAASVEQLQLAVGAYELLAAAAKDKQESAKALLSLGWVYRALNDWNASTAAWDRAADTAKDSVVGADALWHAADNLAWTGQPAEAVKRLRRFTTEHASDARIRAAADQIESLNAESRRTSEWLADPVASLQKEIAERAGRRRPHEVYASAVQWLQARQNTAAIITISRWATTQTDWPIQARISAHFDLVDGLLRQPPASDDAKRAAANILAKIVVLAPSDDWAVSATIRRSRLLSDLKQFDAADHALTEIGSRWKGNPQWEPSVLTERIRSLLDRDDPAAAKALQGQLLRGYPEYELPTELARTLAAIKNGGGR